MSVLIFILLLVLLILVHEFGHFVVAKAFKIRVDEFGIFFPPRLLGFKWGETEYTLNSIPLGGFVKIFGENGEDSDTETEKNIEAKKDMRRNFSQKSRWIQAAVLVAGVFFNMLFAWLAVSAGYVVGMQTSASHRGFGVVEHPQTMITQVSPESPASKAGVESNDIVQTVETATASLATNQVTADGVQQFIQAHQDESVMLLVSRKTATTTEQRVFLAKPVAGIAPDHKAIGIGLDDVGILRLSPPLALAEGAILTESMTVELASGLGGLVTGLFHGTANLGEVSGPIGIVSMGASTESKGFVATLTLLALISVDLAIINLLPIPGLDGGRLLFVIIEGVTRRPISEKFATRATIISIALLISLVIIISFHDVLHLIHPAV